MNQWHVSGNANCNEITWYCTWSINKAIEEDQDVGYDKKNVEDDWNCISLNLFFSIVCHVIKGIPGLAAEDWASIH